MLTMAILEVKVHQGGRLGLEIRRYGWVVSVETINKLNYYMRFHYSLGKVG